MKIIQKHLLSLIFTQRTQNWKLNSSAKSQPSEHDPKN